MSSEIKKEWKRIGARIDKKTYLVLKSILSLKDKSFSAWLVEKISEELKYEN